MSTTSLYNTTQQTGTVSSENLTSLYSSNTNFTTGIVNSSVYSVNGGTGVTVDPTTGNVVVSIGQDVSPSSNVTFANVTATGNLSNNYFTLANSAGTNGQVLTTNGSGATAWTTVSSLGLVNSVSGSGAGISVSPTTGNVVVTNTGVTSIVAGTNISVSSATGAVTINATDTNTTYNIDASSTTGGANLNLTGSDSSVDSVKFASGTGITVSRTDANTITITNITPGGTGVTSLTGTANQINVSSSTGAVTLSTPQDIAATSTPTFAGVNAGNVTVGVTTDNTITTSTGNLVLDANSNLVNVTAALQVGTDNLYVDAGKVGINTTLPGQELTVSDAGDGYVQFGMVNTERTWLVTNNAFDDLISYSVVPTGGGATNRLQFDATGGNQWFPTGRLGVATAAPAYTLDVGGDARISTDLTVGSILQINGATSGYSTFIAAPTGANINYQLPASQGAANTVLTNNGSGSLTWALPGGGGSTFGNVTIGIDTDNTISTTTDDLILDSASGTIAINVPTVTTDAATLTLFPTTTTTLNLAGAATTFNLGTGNSSVTLSVGSKSSIGTTTVTTTSTTTVTAASTTRNAMKVMVHMVQGSNVHLVEALLLKVDATTAMLTTYGEMYNTTPLATFTADVSGGSTRLLATPTSATSTVFYAVRTTLD